MEKPDFEQLLRKIGNGVISKSVAINMCELVWNTYVVPLQEKIGVLENICEMDRKGEFQYNQRLKEIEQLKDDNKSLREEIERMNGTKEYVISGTVTPTPEDKRLFN